MRKIFCIFFLLFISYSSTFAVNEVKIISREEWWANETYRYIDSPEWKAILKKRKENAEKVDETVYTQKQVDAYKKRQAQLKEINNILTNEYWNLIETQDKKIYYHKWHALAWPISKSKKIQGIVIHHTYSDYKTSLEWVRQIYKYHALTREWWDIWYNYLIWKDWLIYEWRAWWDYAVGAHDKYNNISNIWIALIWDYSKNPINIKQYNALKGLIRSLIDKYNIDITKKWYFHETCFANDCEKALKTELKWPIIGHRDAWHTTCPGDALYAQIQDIKADLKKLPSSVARSYKKKVFKSLGKFPDEKLIDILAKIEDDLDKKSDSNKLKLKWLIIDYFKYKSSKKYITARTTDSKINIKLTYPDDDEIKIKSWWVELKIKRRWNSIYVKGQKYNVLKIPKKDANTILEISSWDRIPEWDKSGKYNDNKFRWDLIVYAKNNKLVVVNRLYIEDYLKWLWEVSNFENPEKIKTIIIAARSYATWYTTKARKFPWELYDWVDNPSVFQKYLWYWLEERSPIVSKMVDETKGQIISYNWELIKPWYFSNSEWKTLSFYDYCTIRYSDEVCYKQSIKYPYLQSVIDTWSKWKIKAWHWVWISWAWAKYFAERWWIYDMIIKYFLKWVEVL